MKQLLIIITLLFSTQSFATDGAGNYAIWGSGSKSCHSYNQALAAGQDAPYKDYTMGYLTAYNHTTAETYSISAKMTLDDVMGSIGEECELKPIISFEQALVNFITDHYEKRTKSGHGGF